MNQWLFKKYHDGGYSSFRFVIYLVFWYYYKEVNPINLDQWLTPNMGSSYRPISFFYIFDFVDLQVLRGIPIFRLWSWAMLASAIGFIFPISSLMSFLGLLLMAGLSLNFGKIHHVNHMPVVILGILSLSIYPGKYSIDQFILNFWKIKLPRPTAWALKSAQIYMCMVYFASGVQKLRNSGLDWVFSDNMQHIILTRPTVTSLGLWIAQFPWLCKGIALLTLSADILAPLALFSKRARLVLIPTLFMFHIGTLTVLGMHGYFVPYNLCYLVWVPWEKLFSFKRQGHLLLWGSIVFERIPFLSRVAQSLYVNVVFPSLERFLRFKYGKGVQLVLRHSILKKSFNPFLSDIDYSVVVDKDFTRLDNLLRDLLFLKKSRIFDYPQIYIREEWEELHSLGEIAFERWNFIWNYRKIGWLRNYDPQNVYERFKKERAIRIGEEIVAKHSHHLFGDFYPKTNRELPQVSVYSRYLELTNSSRVVSCDVHQLLFLTSHLPGELNWIELGEESLEFKRQLWIFEYFLSRSHLRLHSRETFDSKEYKIFLRDLEAKYKILFLQSIVAEGEEFDLDKK